MSDCFRRAFETGLRYKNITNLEISLLDIPVPAEEDDVKIWVNNYSLDYRNGFEFNNMGGGEIEKFMKRPALVGYYIPGNEKAEINAHVVFVSDILPFLENQDVIFYIFGWE